MGEFLMPASATNRSEAASRVKRWTRERFGLGADTTILVTELESGTPGFPPLHTVIAFWTAERKHYHFRVFRPLEQVGEEDIPPTWYREALAVTPGVECTCC
jgi:nitrate reductase delta subunit